MAAWLSVYLCKYINFTMTDMKTGDAVLISPDLTHLAQWTAGRVIEVEDNPFVGIVISAETGDKDVFFGRADLFKLKA